MKMDPFFFFLHSRSLQSAILDSDALMRDLRETHTCGLVQSQCTGTNAECYIIDAILKCIAPNLDGTCMMVECATDYIIISI